MEGDHPGTDESTNIITSQSLWTKCDCGVSKASHRTLIFMLIISSQFHQIIKVQFRTIRAD